MSDSTHVTLRVPRNITFILRNAIETRASDFERPLPQGVDRPSNSLEQSWKDIARALRALAAQLPRT